MIGYLYRYPHPTESEEFLYVGQGAKRDKAHRSGKTSFGRRFKRNFPSIELSQPIREEVYVKNQQELNELETIWMFQYHTWRGYSNGMNLTIPGSQDYRDAAKIVGDMNAKNGWIAKLGRMNIESGRLAAGRTSKSCVIGGRIGGKKRFKLHGSPQTIEGSRKGGLTQGPISGRIAVLSGQLAKTTSKGGKTAGRMAVESGHIYRVQKMGCSLGGAAASHTRWHVRESMHPSNKNIRTRPKPNPRCTLCSEQGLVVAFA